MNNSMRQILDRIEQVLAVISGTLFSAVFVFTVINIVTRNLGGVALLWVPGMIRMSFIWSVLLAVAVLYRRDDHLQVDWFILRASSAVQRVVGYVTHVVMVGFLALLIVNGMRVVRIRMRISYETWNFPTGWAYLALPTAAAIMLLFTAEKLFSERTDRQ
jgi:TRAP-type C4-dicarboxylate transport system permease small subunit